MKQEFNINNYVEFVLTERGAEQLNQYIYEHLWNRTNNQKYLDEMRHPSVAYKEGDSCREQFWLVMQIFGGDNTNLGLETFCKEATISFDVKELINE